MDSTKSCHKKLINYNVVEETNTYEFESYYSLLYKL